MEKGEGRSVAKDFLLQGNLQKVERNGGGCIREGVVFQIGAAGFWSGGRKCFWNLAECGESSVPKTGNITKGELMVGKTKKEKPGESIVGV